MIIGALNEVVYSLLFISCFCRLSRSNDDVRPRVIAGFVFMAMASVLCIFAPILWGVPTTWSQVLIGAAVLFKQSATSYAWLESIPPIHLHRPKK